MKKVLSYVLVLCMMLSCVFTADFISVDTQAGVVEVADTSASTGPQSSIQGSAILHCFNWSYNSIKNNLQAIKDAGYTAVQTSPVQAPKDYNGSWRDQGGQWWKLYQPLGFSISNNTWLGTKSELKSLCDTAESMGIKVIVDVVANHLAGEGPGYGAINGGLESNVKRSEFFRNDYYYANNDNDRHNMTTGSIGMPDLNTNNPQLQEIVKNFLVDCINQGVDGFRFDAAKHIELPTDSGNSSNFWPAVIEGSQKSTSREIYYYGEILNGCATDIGNYTRYMSITDNYTGDGILVAANNSNASGLANSNYAKGAAPDKNVLWVESHDTYMGESGSAGISKTQYISDDKIIKAWGMVGSRADASALFFARPANNMGDASSNTTWKCKTVAEVNKFKNYFDGQSEYLGSEGSIAYNFRGNSGVVLVNASGTNCSVNISAQKMANGTYKDAVSGSTFNVSDGRITGNIGNTGVAVVYNPSSTPVQTEEPTKATEKSTEAPKVRYLCGDIDLDGIISVIDVTRVQSHVAKSLQLTGVALKAADNDLDNKVSIVDATMIQIHVARLTRPDSYCGKYLEMDGNVVDSTVEPTQPIIDGDYIYFKNNDNWDKVMIYYWSDANDQMISWPGENMESIGNNEYRAKYPTEATYVIFNNGGNGNQTPNLTLEGKNKIYNNGNWSDYFNTPNPTVSSSDSKYIYFKNNENWGEVKAYYWSDSNDNMISWPGEYMEPIGNNVYRCEVPADATKIIFNNNNQGSKTSDLNLEGLGKIYDNGSWSTYNG